MTKARLETLEKAAWKLLFHDVARAGREKGYLCTEGQDVLAYFEKHGAPVWPRSAPSETMIGHLLKDVKG